MTCMMGEKVTSLGKYGDKGVQLTYCKDMVQARGEKVMVPNVK